MDKTSYYNARDSLDDIEKVLNKTIDELTKIIHEFLAEGSGWQIQEIYNQYFNIHIYKPLKGSSYIPLPKELQNPMKGLINIQNEDEKCFMYCHLYHLHKDEIKSNPQRVSKYKKYLNDCGFRDLDYTGIEFPVEINQYNKIGNMNNIRINVFGYENKQIFPLYISDVQNTNEMNLLLIDNNEGKRHYVYIKDFNRLMTTISTHFCMYCLHCFSTKEILNNHKGDCLKINGKQNIKMPAEGSKIYFKNFYKTSESPFVIYADFESLLILVDSSENYQNESYTKQYQEHKICSYSYKVICSVNEQYTKPIKMRKCCL